MQSLRATPFTFGLLIVLVAIFVLEVFWQTRMGLPLSMGIDGRVLFELGANYTPAFQAGQYWRTFTACFLHVDVLHIFMNGLGLFYLAPFIERNFGGVKMLLAFMLTGIAGSLLTNLVHLDSNYLSAGASGGLYGLFGIIFATGKRYKAQLPPSFQTWINQNLGLMVIFSFAPQIDAAGHFGGLGLGLVLGAMLKPADMAPAGSEAIDELDGF